MNKSVRSKKLALLLLYLASGLCHGEIYKWVDERGKTHYSQTPPGKNAEKIEIDQRSQPQTNQPAGGTFKRPLSSVENQKKYSDYLEQERLERKEKREKKLQQRAEQRTKCIRTKADLDDMNQGGILYYELDENGERKVVEDQRVNARKRKLSDYLKKNCSGV